MIYPIYRKLQRMKAKKTYEDLYIKDVQNGKYIRMGNNEDGGYVMLDDFAGIDGVLSFGVGENITWEEQIADTGVAVEMYDPTVDNVKIKKENLYFYKLGVARTKNEEKQMDSLENILNSAHLKNSTDMILKMDIEGAEWDILPYLGEDTLNRFRQIVFELHGLTKISPLFHQKTHASFANLNKTHQLVHVHANNCGKSVEVEGNVRFPWFLEATYVNKNRYKFIENEREFPTELDCANVQGKPEIKLGRWH